MRTVTYDDLKKSPLVKDGAEPEEAALWLELNGMCNAKGVMQLMSCIERNFQTHSDWLTGTGSAIGFASGYASANILFNLFNALFKLDVLKHSTEDIKKLASFSKKKASKIKTKCKKVRAKQASTPSALFMHREELRRLDNLFEIYAEMNDRLEFMMKSIEAAE